MLPQVNPNSYYESMGRPGLRGGERERQLAAFSRSAVVAAEVWTTTKLACICYPIRKLAWWLRLRTHYTGERDASRRHA